MALQASSSTKFGGPLAPLSRFINLLTNQKVMLFFYLTVLTKETP